MAQRERKALLVDMLRSIGRPKYRVLLLGAFTALVLAVCALAVAGAMVADGESFEVKRSDVSAGSEAVEAGDRLDEEEGERAVSGEVELEFDNIVVDVGGAVVAPGVYELADGARVTDAIAAAGGLAADADTSALNQAAPVSDGEKVYIPRVGETPPSSGTIVGGATTSPNSEAIQLVNINTASVEELDVLPGIGPATAQAIVDDRTQNGPFSSPEDLMRVSGIGEKKFEKLSNLICV